MSTNFLILDTTLNISQIVELYSIPEPIGGLQ
jgi:hypothetical protein